MVGGGRGGKWGQRGSALADGAASRGSSRAARASSRPAAAAAHQDIDNDAHCPHVALHSVPPFKSRRVRCANHLSAGGGRARDGRGRARVREGDVGKRAGRGARRRERKGASCTADRARCGLGLRLGGGGRAHVPRVPHSQACRSACAARPRAMRRPPRRTLSPVGAARAQRRAGWAHECWGAACVRGWGGGRLHGTMGRVSVCVCVV